MIRPRQKIGKYQIERKLGEGGFAEVYRALDTIEGVRVALKIPFPQRVDNATLEEFRKEIRLVAKLKHPHILPLKNAELIDGKLVMAYPLGDRTLANRLQSRLAASLALKFTEQILDAAAYAHSQRIIHCDITPENLILFPDNHLMLTDFGIAKVSHRTVRASGTGTIGYVAPEQAMGLPSFRSDVFSIGLIVYRMFSGRWPEWPFQWPPPGIARVRDKLHADMVGLVHRSLQFDPRKRFRDAQQMLSRFRRVKSRAIRQPGATSSSGRKQSQPDWRTMRFRQFRKQFGASLGTIYQCQACRGPVSEPMHWCPWCGCDRQIVTEETRFPQQCPRCRRGMKLDWRYCPWCYGPGFELSSNRRYSDARYVARCGNPKCVRKDLIPFMRYCPWCHRKIRRKWKLPETTETCHDCGWGVAADFWNFCCWCGKGL